MTVEQKELYIKIKNSIEKGAFEDALSLCDGYAVEYPDDVNGWIYYILAYCKAKSTKELVKCSKNIEDTPVYANAMSNLDDAGCEKLKSLSESIARVRKKREGNPEYSGCIRYFTQRINELKADIDSLSDARNQSMANDKDNFKQIKKEGSSLFANNLICFIAFSAIIFLPFAFVSILLNTVKAFWLLQLLPAIIATVIIIVLGVKRVKRQKSFSKNFDSYKETGDVYAVEIKSLGTEIQEKTERRKQLVKIYKVLKKHPKLNVKSIKKLWAKFDNIYNGVQNS